MDLEEEFQQVPVGGLFRIEDDLDRLGMGAVVAVGRVRHVAAAVTDARRDHTGLPANEILHAPEASARQNGAFLAHRKSSWFVEHPKRIAGQSPTRFVTPKMAIR